MIYSAEKIMDIENKYRLPCYIFDEESFKSNYMALYHSLKSIYDNYEIGYSYKTNYAPAICKIVKKLGGYAEVVSDMEYTIARTIGYGNDKIIYNGPFKGPLLEEHLLYHGIVNVDNLEELSRIIEFTKIHRNAKFKIGIRVNIDIGQKFVSRFGIDTDSDDLLIAKKLINAEPNLKLVGLHCHIGQARGLDAWEKRTKIMLELSDKYIEGIPEYIDLGSGMFGDLDNDMKSQFTCKVPTYAEYANVTARIVNNHYIDCKIKPKLFTEPGTTVDNRYIDLISKVQCIKKIKNKYIAIMDCSIHNLGDVRGSLRLPIKRIQGNYTISRFYDELDMVGYTCLERDVPYRRYSGYLNKGDYIVFGNVGGYSNVDKPPFILPQCAMIGINDKMEYVIKRKETVNDILETYVY